MPTGMHFDGETIEPTRDNARLASQLERVQKLMRDGRWRTLAEIATAVGASEAGVSARLRDLRKRRFGGYVVEREYVGHGLWMYRVCPPEPKQQELFSHAS